ncbi:MAG TPA: YCF48-related protein [Candidatus Deferrimicrobium sp.]|nr:YCF48-related protein [Candidatus Deferrimicrobium sp.]
MNHFLLIVAAVATMSVTALSQGWEAVNSPTDDIITAICALDDKTLFIVTAKGAAARTDDAGKHWRISPVASDIYLDDISFVDSKTGIVCGRKGALYRTADGGATWENLSLSDTNVWLMDAEMFNSQTGLIIGMASDTARRLQGLLLRTTDGGRSWRPQPRLGMGYSEILYRPGEAVYLLSMGQLHLSRDLGKNWETVPTVEGVIARTLSIRGQGGILAGPDGMSAYSSDGGRTWSKSDASAQCVYIAAELVDDNVGYVGGVPQILMRTADGGRTWKQELMARSFDVLDLCLVGKRLYAVGRDGGIIAKKVR